MLNHNELYSLGFYFPKNKENLKTWQLPEKCSSDIFKQLPLKIQVFYSLKFTDGFHYLTEL